MIHVGRNVAIKIHVNRNLSLVASSSSFSKCYKVKYKKYIYSNITKNLNLGNLYLQNILISIIYAY